MISGSTRLYAVLGRPVHHSRSPALHNAWFAEHRIDAVYVALEVPEGREQRVLEAVDTLGLAGANLTTPLKERVLADLVHVDEDARRIGAVNLLIRDGDRWQGANTDAEGFCRSVEAHGVRLDGRIAAVIGTGGAARAVTVGLANRGAREVRILGRRRDRAEALASADARFTTGVIETSSIVGVEVLVVATSGRAEALDRLDPGVLAPRATWVDLNYWDPDPPGSRAAVASGCTFVDGGGMLAWQAALSFERWIGILPAVGSTGISAR